MFSCKEAHRIWGASIHLRMRIVIEIAIIILLKVETVRLYARSEKR
jgi:hypothetical protein